jgi:hypothetical protein
MPTCVGMTMGAWLAFEVLLCSHAGISLSCNQLKRSR